MKEVVFPLMNVTITELDDILDIQIRNQYDYPRLKFYEDFKKNYLHHEYVDCDGNVFQLTGTKPTPWYKRLLHWGQDELDFRFTGRTMTFDQLKQFLSNRYQTWDDEETRNVLLENMDRASDIADLVKMW